MVMITMDAHARDVIASLVHAKVESPAAFQWQSQLKQRIQGNAAIVQVADAVFTYGYEYLGNGHRLVITPLTDRIYVTATQALNLKMGCAPAGPAGTGPDFEHRHVWRCSFLHTTHGARTATLQRRWLMFAMGSLT